MNSNSEDRYHPCSESSSSESEDSYFGGYSPESPNSSPLDPSSLDFDGFSEDDIQIIPQPSTTTSTTTTSQKRRVDDRGSNPIPKRRKISLAKVNWDQLPSKDQELVRTILKKSELKNIQKEADDKKKAYNLAIEEWKTKDEARKTALRRYQSTLRDCKTAKEEKKRLHTIWQAAKQKVTSFQKNEEWLGDLVEQDKQKSKDKCPICYEELTNGEQLWSCPNKHNVHINCPGGEGGIDAWFASTLCQKKGPKCPICRVTIEL